MEASWRDLPRETLETLHYQSEEGRLTTDERRVASRYFFLESLLMKALTCTDTAKVPQNTPKCTEKPQEMYMNVKILLNFLLNDLTLVENFCD